MYLNFRLLNFIIKILKIVNASNFVNYIDYTHSNMNIVNNPIKSFIK